MLVQEFIEVLRVTLSGCLETLFGVSAGIAYNCAVQSDLVCCCWQLVVVEDFIGKIRDIDTCIAFSGDIEIALFKVGKFLKKCDQSKQIISSRCLIIIGNTLTLTKANTSWRLDIKQISFLVPGVLV
jgi:hypothetical protein